MATTAKNPFQHIVEPLDPDDPKQQFFNLSKLRDSRYGNNVQTSCRCNCIVITADISERFTVPLLLRATAILHPGSPGVRCPQLWWVSGEELRCGKYPQLEADPDSNCGGSIQTGPCHPPGLHVRLCSSSVSGFQWVVRESTVVCFVNTQYFHKELQ